MTIEHVAQTMNVEDARRLTERIRLTAFTVREGMEKMQHLVDEAKAGNAHLSLGYPSWTAYLSDTLGSEPLRLPRDQRQELVGYLSGEGMSTRAIAPIVGADQATVVRDLATGDANASPAQPPTIATPEGVVIAEQRRVDLPPFDPATGEVRDETKAPDKVTGLDGKQYARPEPPTPRRKPLADVARDAGWELRKAVERLTRLTEDDRFTSNEEQVATHLRGHLQYTVEACQGLLDLINQSQED